MTQSTKCPLRESWAVVDFIFEEWTVWKVLKGKEIWGETFKGETAFDHSETNTAMTTTSKNNRDCRGEAVYLNCIDVCTHVEHKESDFFWDQKHYTSQTTVIPQL